jgi:hypothetical protein
MADKLLKLWDNWEDGIGFPVDDGRQNGFCGLHTEYEQCFYGFRGELRVAQQSIDTGVALTFQPAFSFDVANPTSGRNVYLLGVSTGATIAKMRVYISTVPAFTDEGETDYGGTLPFGQPAQYRGNYYWSIPETLTSVIRKLTTSVNGVIGGDTITAGDASSGGGHMALVGHQLAKLSDSDGVSMLTTAADATANTNWGSYFPVGDSSETALGIKSLNGLTFVLRDNGLWTFNDRGGGAQLFEVDHSTWLNSTFGVCQAVTTWLGGLVYIGPDGSLYYYRLGYEPVNIGLTGRPSFFTEPISPIGHNTFDNTLSFRGVRGIGDYLYAFVRGNGSNSYNLVGQAKQGNPTEVIWHQLAAHEDETERATMLPVFGLSSSYKAGVVLYFDDASFKVYYQHIHPNGSPFITNLSEATALVKAPAEANAFMSELRFTPAEKPRYLIVYPKNLTSGDQFQMQAFIDGNSLVNLGAPITANRPVKIELPYVKDVFSLMVGIDFDTTATTDTRSSLPAIYRMELWGEE